MNEELTREVLEAMKKCNHDCSTCSANKVCIKCNWKDVMQSLATALLEEMDKPKAWDGVPNNVVRAQVYYFCKNGHFYDCETFTREPPKSRSRIIAEEIAELVNRAIEGISVKEIEAVLNKYAE